jgi:hypothetical protein
LLIELRDQAANLRDSQRKVLRARARMADIVPGPIDAMQRGSPPLRPHRDIPNLIKESAS